MDSVILVPRAAILLASTTDRDRALAVIAPGWAQNQKSANYAQAQKFELIMDTVETIVLAAHPGPSHARALDL